MSEPPAPRWGLKPAHVAGLDARIEVPAGAAVTVGRAASNDVALTADEHASVSGHHARFAIEDEALVVEDLGSLNGTFVNGSQVRRAELGDGDLVQLGATGPRFVVERSGGVTATVVGGPGEPARRFGQSTLISVKQALGLDAHENVGEMVRTGHRRQRWIAASIVLIVVGVGIGIYALRVASERELEGLRTLNALLAEQLGEAEGRFRQQELAWRVEKERLVGQREALQQRIQKLEAEGQSSSASLAVLRDELARTTEKLEAYDPQKIERVRIEGVRRVGRAVVFIEAKIRYRNREDGRLLRMVDLGHGVAEPTFEEGEGEDYSRESSGSGFVVSADGHVLTNAHVVRPRGHDQPLELGGGGVLDPELSLAVVFNGESRRYPAEVVRVAQSETEDLAVLRIEPFDGMPWIDGLRTDRGPPPNGSEVFIYGYPLGKRTIQSGDTLSGSVLKGIMSRVAPPFLQIDAAVHPGNSGGPMTDASGNVLGVVAAVQRMPEGQFATAIGYVIPIDAAAKVWPVSDDK